MKEVKNLKSTDKSFKWTFSLSLAIVLIFAVTLALSSCKKKPAEDSSVPVVTTTEASVSETEPTETEPTNGDIVLGQTKGYATDKLRVRSGPSTADEIIGGLDINDEVTILEVHGDWYKVRDRGYEGFVSAQYISLTKVETTTSESVSSTEATTTTTTAAAN